MGQMTNAQLSSNISNVWQPQNKYKEGGINYDKNGNITTMSRTDADGSTLHDISYSYDGNQLSSVNINNTPSATFEYDFDGNMTFDGEKGVSVEYNELNLPSRIFANSEEIRYIYSSGGEKLATITNSSLTYYRSAMVYGKESATSSESLLYMSHPEGVVAKNTSGWNYKYFKKDHLGNTRRVLSAVTTTSGVEFNIDQTTDYYPYGLSWEYNDLHQNLYLHGGKELQDQTINGNMLKLYDFGSRYYNPLLGRWFNIDPALQFTNPYVYCANSPMMYVDPDGEFIISFLSGFIRGLIKGENPFSRGWESVENSFNITMGLFKGDFGQILSRLTWELPQTILGYAYGIGVNLVDNIKEVGDYGGATVVSTYAGPFGGAVTLGSFIYGGSDISADPTNALFMHEYGHYLQSQASGLAFLSRYGIPSIISAWGEEGTHSRHPGEQDANARSIKYFENKLGQKHIEDNWGKERHPIFGYDFEKSYRDPANEKALKGAKLAAYSWQGLFGLGIISGGINSIVLHQKKKKNLGNYPVPEKDKTEN